jgi:hypothetical protein
MYIIDPHIIDPTGDKDQRILLDLGEQRYADKIGATFSSTDREVWEHVMIQVSTDNVSFCPCVCCVLCA